MAAVCSASAVLAKVTPLAAVRRAGCRNEFILSPGLRMTKSSGPGFLLDSTQMLFAQVTDVITGPAMEEIKRVANKADQTGIIYMVFLMMIVGFAGAFFLIRYVLNHAREIHTESNKTLLDISTKHESRCDSLTKTFSSECAQLRQVILRLMSDARDMVHATRDIASTAVTAVEFSERYAKKEEEIKAKRDRDQPVQT